MEVLDPTADLKGAVELQQPAALPPDLPGQSTLSDSASGLADDATRFVPTETEFRLTPTATDETPLSLPPEADNQSFNDVFTTEQEIRLTDNQPTSDDRFMDEPVAAAATTQSQVYEGTTTEGRDAVQPTSDGQLPEQADQLPEEAPRRGFWAGLWGLLRGQAGTGDRADEAASTAARQSERDKRS